MAKVKLKVLSSLMLNSNGSFYKLKDSGNPNLNTDSIIWVWWALCLETMSVTVWKLKSMNQQIYLENSSHHNNKIRNIPSLWCYKKSQSKQLQRRKHFSHQGSLIQKVYTLVHRKCSKHFEWKRLKRFANQCKQTDCYLVRKSNLQIYFLEFVYSVQCQPWEYKFPLN